MRILLIEDDENLNRQLAQMLPGDIPERKPHGAKMHDIQSRAAKIREQCHSKTEWSAAIDALTWGRSKGTPS